MPKKKKKQKAEKVPKPEVDLYAEEERELQLRQEYEELTDTLSNLKRRVERLRLENNQLQSEKDRTHMEAKEYTAYINKRNQALDNEISALEKRHQQEMQMLLDQRKRAEEKHAKEANELKRQILEKKSELRSLESEIEELSDVEEIQKQQLARITELKGQIEETKREHSESIHALTTEFCTDKHKHKAQARDRILTVKKEAEQSLNRHMQQVLQENQCMRKELQQLVSRAQVLYEHKERLQVQRQRLLLELGHVLGQRQLQPDHGTAEHCQQEAAEASAYKEAQDPVFRNDQLTIVRSIVGISRENDA